MPTQTDTTTTHLTSDLLPGHLNTSLIAGIVVGFLLRVGGGAAGVLLVFYLNRVVSGTGKIDPAVIAWLTVAYFASEFLLAPIFGSWSDTIGRKPFLLVGPLIAAFAVQIHPLTTILAVIFFGRVLEGLATSATTPGTLGFLSDVTAGSPALRGRVMGLYELGSLLGIVLGPFLGGRLWDAFGRDGLRLVSVFPLLAALLVFLFIRESRPVPVPDAEAVSDAARTHTPGWGERLRAYRGLLALPTLWRFAPAWIAINGVVGLWFSHASGLLSRATADPTQLLSGGFAGEQVSNIFLAFGVAFMVGIAFWSNLYGRLRKTDLMIWSVGGTFAVCVVLFAINMRLLGPAGGWWLLPFLFAAIFVESGFTPVALAYLADITEGRVQDRGTVMGLYSVFLALGNVIGAGIGAPLINTFGFNGLLIGTALLAAVAGAAVFNLRRTTGD
ncbi:MAG: MFS transporter [Chloroflexota bacterium]|nr:MFS transporter [Chloroflexota bacterium]